MNKIELNCGILRKLFSKWCKMQKNNNIVTLFSMLNVDSSLTRKYSNAAT